MTTIAVLYPHARAVSEIVGMPEHKVYRPAISLSIDGIMYGCKISRAANDFWLYPEHAAERAREIAARLAARFPYTEVRL